jgi:hypothetical protein
MDLSPPKKQPAKHLSIADKECILNIQRVSKISTLILTSDSSRQEQQNFYVSFFRNVIFISMFFPP